MDVRGPLTLDTLMIQAAFRALAWFEPTSVPVALLREGDLG